MAIIIIYHSGAIARPTVYSARNLLDYFLASANCTGSENNLLECSYSIMKPGYTCSFEAGVICQGILIGNMQLQNLCLITMYIVAIIILSLHLSVHVCMCV